MVLLIRGDFKPGKSLGTREYFFGGSASERYYSTSGKEPYKLDFINGNCRSLNVMPKEFFAIGDFGTMEIICIGVEGNYYGKVYIVDSEEMNGGEETEGAWLDNVYFVADNLKEFFNGMVGENQVFFLSWNFLTPEPKYKLVGLYQFYQKLGLGILPKTYSELKPEFQKVLDYIKNNPEIELTEQWLKTRESFKITEFDEMKRFNDFFYNILKEEQKKELEVLLKSKV